MAGDQLSGLDTAFLCLESADAPMHLGALAVFDGRAAVPPGRLVTLLGERAARLSRLRRRVVPLRTATGGDVWQADPRFDVRRHVQLHRLDGADQPSLAEVAARLMAEPLDVAHPLWQVHVLTGLADDRFAVLVKMHHAVADGLRAVEIGLGLLDGYTDLVAARTMPEAVDRSVLGTVRSAVRFAAHPDRLLGRVARTAAGLPGAMREVGGIAASVLSNVRLRTDRSPLTAGARLSVPAGRRLALLRLDGSELRQVRRVHGGTDNDILLAVLAGALRDWLSQRGQPVEDVRLRVLVPVSRRSRTHDRRRANVLSGYLCELPVHEGDPLNRLYAVRAAMRRNKAAGPRRGPGALPLLADRVPGAVHRVVTPLTRYSAGRLFDTVFTNVPVPDLPLSLGGAALREVYPIVPLAHGQALGVAASTHRGTVHIGLHGDARVVSDLDRFAAAIPEALQRLRSAQPSLV